MYQTTIKRDGKMVPIRWCKHFYPLVDKRLKRHNCVEALVSEGIPYLISSECDMCPHQDIERWDRHTPEVLYEIAGIEASMNGEFFFTDERIPLLDALQKKRDRKETGTMDLDFGCGNAYCGI